MPQTTAFMLTNPISLGVLRRSDTWGAGRFGASRGRRQHNGADIVARLGQEVLSPIDGRILRMSYPYASDTSLTGVMIEGVGRHIGMEVKIFYMTPMPGMVGQSVKAGEKIGLAQSLLSKYPGITNHIHLEVRQNGIVVDPQSLIPNLH